VNNTPWGDMPVADSHVHFFSHRFFAGLAEQRKMTLETLESALGWQVPDSNPEHLADRWAAELDRFGVEKAALIASVPGDHESVIAAVRQHPTRFTGYMMVNPLSVDAHAQVEHALNSGYMHGLCFFPAMHRYPIYDEKALALIDLAAGKPGTVVFVHCGVLSVGVRKKLGLPCLFDMRYSNPIDVHAIALEYPDVSFVVPHFGAGYFREALMLADLCPNVYLDTSSSNSWMRYGEVHLDLRSVFRRALDVVGQKRLLFGTDSSFYPRGWNKQIFDAQATVLYELGLDAATARCILHDNFSQLFLRGNVSTTHEANK
jgi:predicted TIM-barrel fold metal-dependent hydrolase